MRRGPLALVVGLAGALCAPVAFGQNAPEQAVHRALEGRSHLMRACFEQALRRDPTLVTRTDVMRFVVLPNGRARNVEVRLSPRTPAVERCMVRVVERTVFPRHTGVPIPVAILDPHAI